MDVLRQHVLIMFGNVIGTNDKVSQKQAMDSRPVSSDSGREQQRGDAGGDVEVMHERVAITCGSKNMRAGEEVENIIFLIKATSKTRADVVGVEPRGGRDGVRDDFKMAGGYSEWNILKHTFESRNKENGVIRREVGIPLGTFLCKYTIDNFSPSRADCLVDFGLDSYFSKTRKLGNGPRTVAKKTLQNRIRKKGITGPRPKKINRQVSSGVDDQVNLMLKLRHSLSYSKPGSLAPFVNLERFRREAKFAHSRNNIEVISKVCFLAIRKKKVKCML